MGRQLNPHLFQPAKTDGTDEEKNERLSHMAFVGPGTIGPNDSRVEQLESELYQQRKRTQELHSYIEKVSSHIQDWMNAERSRNEKLVQAFQNLEAKHSYFVRECNSKLAQLSGKVNERRTSDIKIQELIDRQNSVIQGFESRLTQLQRLVSEKENQLAGTAAALNEAKMEIMRLKRLS